MDNDTQLRNTLNKLQESNELKELRADAIVDNYCEVEFRDSLDECKNATERTKLKKKFTDYYLVGAGKDFIDSIIQKLKATYGRIVKMFSSLKTSITSLVGSNSVPSVITVGTATSTPNPIHFLMTNKQAKENIASILELLTALMAEFYTLALLIHLSVPSYVQGIVVSLASLKTLINSIPV